MKAKVFVLFLMMFFEAFNLNAEGINLKAKKTKETKVEPIYIQKMKIDPAVDGKDGEKINLEGMVFLFEITKLKKNDKVLCMQELRDFTIDGISYAQATKEKLGLSVEPKTVIVDSYKLVEEDPDLKDIVKNEKSGIVMQTIIFGSEMPQKGKVSVTVQVGWGDVDKEKNSSSNEKIEDFNFEFNLSELAESEKQEVLKLINEFKKDKDFSPEHLKNYSQIIEFATKNKDVQITISTDYLPKLNSPDDYSYVFILAYICGNLEKQLVSGNYTNSAKEGIEFELLKYKQLKEIHKDISISFFEDMM
ncbi:MAG: hypothetical protein J6X67_04490 [Treponema sp.]|nr:hypothetical protein [Treponema sp.]